MRIIYIDIDSLRPDHLGCYGYHRNTSPHMDSLAREGVRFTRFYTPDAPCLPSRTALFTGRLGIQTGVINHGGTNADMPTEGAGRGFRRHTSRFSLAQQLRDAGLYTASISPFPHRHSAYHVWEGFHEMYDTGKGGNETADEVFPVAEKWLRANQDREHFFLHLNFWDPHAAYDTPAEHGNPFAGEPAPAWLTQEIIDSHRLSYGPHDAVAPHGLPPDAEFAWPRGARTIADRDDWKRWIDGYDTGIHYADAHVGKLVSLLKELSLYEDTAIVASADHGENHGELNVYGDHQTADEITCRIPLIVRWPGVTDDQAGRAIDAMHYNLDLAATFLDLAGRKPPKEWDGVSFADTLRNGNGQGRDFLVLSQGAWSCQRSVRWDDWIYIRTYHAGVKDYPSHLLFNLAEDPHETRNLASRFPDLVQKAEARLRAWVSEQLARSGRPDPMLQVIEEGGPFHARESLATVIEHCRRSGRTEHAEFLSLHGGGTPRDDRHKS